MKRIRRRARDLPGVGEPAQHGEVSAPRGARPLRGLVRREARSRPRREPRPSERLLGLRLRLAGLLLLRTGSPRSQGTLPPAASIFSFAVFEAVRETESAFDSSPTPSTLTSTDTLRISRLPLSVSASPRRPLEALLEVAEVHRLAVGAERPIGIASADVLPRSLGSHVDRHLPALEPGGILCEPERDFWPLRPRPSSGPCPSRGRARCACAPCGAAPLQRMEFSSSATTYASFPSGVTETRWATCRSLPSSSRETACSRSCRSGRGRASAACRGASRSGR